MIGAYHYVSGGSDAVDRLLKEGWLLVANERIDPMAAEHLCEGLVDAVSSEGTTAIPKAVSALRDLLGQRLDEIVPFGPTSAITQFQCEDLLAGDLDNVFLSVGTWYPGISNDERNAVSGFVFDAEKLVALGAKFRKYDLLDEYKSVVNDFLYDRGGSKTWTSLRSKLAKVRRESETSGREAIADLRSLDWNGLAELVFPDRISLDLLMEIWKDGTQEWVEYPSLRVT